MHARRRRKAILAIAALTNLVAFVGVMAVGAGSAGAAAGDRVLILASTVTGGNSSIEATQAASKGLAVDVVDAATWSSMTAAQFASYRAIILGDPTCSESTSDISPAVANAKTWGGVVNGNLVIVGTDPVFHASQGGETVTRRGVDFAVDQVGKTGLYVTLSCYYHGTDANTPVPLLDGIGPGGFTVTGVGCYNSAHIVAESPALSGVSDSTLSNWSCSVHEAFQKWPGSLVPLAIARDFDSSYTASDGSQGPPYILAGGNIKSFPLSLSPLTGTAPADGAHAVTAQLLDGSTRSPVSGAMIGFKITAGPDKGVSGFCSPGSPFLCFTSSDGKVTWTYSNNGNTGTDTIQAFYDQNRNNSADLGEPQTTAGMTWTNHIKCTHGSWRNNSSPLNLYYSYGGAHRYLGNVYQGGVNWSNAGTKIRVAQWPGIPRAIHIPVGDTRTSQNWWGMTMWDTTADGTIASVSISLNQRTLDRERDFMRTKVSTHELGHALGMDHPAECGISSKTKSVMHQGPLSYNTPQAHDKDILARLYP